MILLAVVTVFTSAVAAGATLLGPVDTVRLADRTAVRVERSPAADKRIIDINDQPPVRMIGAPFVPNTNPRER
ncbi:hypothetical protein [Bradyrhizobium icense]|nr:hypothetical protein [Bradyrhizobium icense]